MTDGRAQNRVALGLGAAGFALGLLAFWNNLTPPGQVAAAPDPPPKPSSSWLTGSGDEKFAAIERHLRGWDVSMAEIGYRYAELVSAGKTRNWEYAQYQAEKIDLSLRLAVERRPKRAKSARPFLDESLPEVVKAIKTKDGPTLDAALDGLRTGCIQCHRAENVLYMGTLFATIQPTAPATAKAIQDFKTKLTPEDLRGADRSRGRLVFSKHCASCHRLFGEGTDNGPDLTGLQRTNLDYVLTTVIDPNAVIGRDYEAVAVVTTSEKTITGLVKHEDTSTLTIQTATDKVTVPKKEIERRSPSKLSFMPEGLLQKLSDEEVRDLIGYLQGSDQVPLPAGSGGKDSE
jgi:putative heme-binding domain-containing protein